MLNITKIKNNQKETFKISHDIEREFLKNLFFNLSIEDFDKVNKILERPLNFEKNFCFENENRTTPVYKSFYSLCAKNLKEKVILKFFDLIEIIPTISKEVVVNVAAELILTQKIDAFNEWAKKCNIDKENELHIVSQIIQKRLSHSDIVKKTIKDNYSLVIEILKGYHKNTLRIGLVNLDKDLILKTLINCPLSKTEKKIIIDFVHNDENLKFDKLIFKSLILKLLHKDFYADKEVDKLESLGIKKDVIITYKKDSLTKKLNDIPVKNDTSLKMKL